MRKNNAVGGVEAVFYFRQLIFFLFWLYGKKDLSSLTRGRTLSPALEVQSLNHWTAREIPEGILYRVLGRC